MAEINNGLSYTYNKDTNTIFIGNVPNDLISPANTWSAVKVIDSDTAEFEFKIPSGNDIKKADFPSGNITIADIGNLNPPSSINGYSYGYPMVDRWAGLTGALVKDALGKTIGIVKEVRTVYSNKPETYIEIAPLEEKRFKKIYII